MAQVGRDATHDGGGGHAGGSEPLWAMAYPYERGRTPKFA